MPAKTKYATREQWLNAAIALLTPEFNGYKVPQKIRVACGFPSKNALSAKKQRIGECWSDSASEGKYFELFISPVLNDIAGPQGVLSTLIHEMVHATVGLQCGHKGEFKKCALSIGLEGKMTATYAGATLLERFKVVAKQLGGYPHDRLSAMTNGKKKEACRLLKANCPDCGYVVRVTRKWIDEAGLPICPCGGQFEESE